MLLLLTSPILVTAFMIPSSQYQHQYHNYYYNRDIKLYQQQSQSQSNNNNNNNNNNNTNKDQNTTNNNNNKKYQFGDITKSIMKNITKKDQYEFGDLSKHVDQQIKQKVASLRNKDQYEFGDLTKYLIEEYSTNNNNGNDNQKKNDDSISSSSSNRKESSTYQFGDITKEIIRRIQSKDYTMEDLIILMKALVSLGIGLSPISSFLPMKLLIDLLNYSIAEQVSTKVASAISLEIDKRMKKVLTGDESYQVGDFTKKAILRYTGKDEYTFGDITKTVVESMQEYDKQKKEMAAFNQNVKENKKQSSLLLGDGDCDNKEATKDLEAWDRKYLQKLNDDLETFE